MWNISICKFGVLYLIISRMGLFMNYDLLVLGGGPGVILRIQAADLGLKVVWLRGTRV